MFYLVHFLSILCNIAFVEILLQVTSSVSEAKEEYGDKDLVVEVVGTSAAMATCFVSSEQRPWWS